MRKLNKLQNSEPEKEKKEESRTPPPIAQYGATAGGWAQADIIRLPDKSESKKK